MVWYVATCWIASSVLFHTKNFALTWILAVAIIVTLWVAWLVLVLRTNRMYIATIEKQAGRCIACGYYLRGSAASKTCPECGQPIAEGTRFEPIEHATREP